MPATEQVHRFRAMASPCAIRLGCSHRSPQELLRAAEDAAEEVLRIERRYSRFLPASIVSRINAAAGVAAVEIDEETAALLAFAGRMHALSDGLFDATSGVLRRAWDFRGTALPDPRALEPLLHLVGWPQVALTATHVRLARPGAELDFGGFAKEYAADRAAARLQAAGLRHGFVNLGGDIRVLGPQTDGRPWTFGIAHPRQRGSLACQVELAEGALATSGDYERYIDVGGRRYCHILDPRTGWPPHNWQSVSVAACTCIAAGAMSTTAMLLGDRARAFLEAQRAPWLGIDIDGTPCGTLSLLPSATAPRQAPSPFPTLAPSALAPSTASNPSTRSHVESVRH